MKNLIVIIALLILPAAGFAQAETNVATTTIETITVKKADAAPMKAKASRSAKHIRVNRKKSNDIISIKAYRKSLKAKVSAKTIVC